MQVCISCGAGSVPRRRLQVSSNVRPHTIARRAHAPREPDDLALTYAITEDAMRSYVEETWGNWDGEEQRLKHRNNFTP